MSTFARLAPARGEAGLARLADDLATRALGRAPGHLRAQREADLGYRLVVAERGRSGGGS